MFEQTILGLVSLIAAGVSTPSATVWPIIFVEERQVLARHELDLTNRLPTEYGSQVFADNILLALHYLKGDVAVENGFPELDGQKFRESDWDKIRQPFTVEFKLEPDQVFAFHENVLPEFNNPAVTMKSRFFMEEGYKALEGLGGNGVCHLASLINWVAKDGGLEVTAKVNHDFYPVPGIPREYGTAIYSLSPEQNLYIKNTLDRPVTFTFTVTATKVDLILN